MSDQPLAADVIEMAEWWSDTYGIADGTSNESPYTPPMMTGNWFSNFAQSFLTPFFDPGFWFHPDTNWQADLQPQPLPGVMDQYGIGQVTPENYTEMAKAYIESRMADGVTFDDSYIISILDAFRQMAGLPPHQFSVDENGAIPMEFENPYGNLISDIKNEFSNLGDSIVDSLPTVNSTIQLVSLAAIVGGIVWLVRK